MLIRRTTATARIGSMRLVDTPAWIEWLTGMAAIPPVRREMLRLDDRP
jgi:hypothetical protein